MNEIATSTESAGLQSGPFSTYALLTNLEAMRSLVTFAELMASSSVAVPQHLRGKKADCLAIVMQAARWGMDPFAVAQKTHLVNGALGYEAQLILAVLQTTGVIKGAPHYEYSGEGNDMRCRVGMILSIETDPRWTQWIRNGDVTTRNSPLWKTNPAQQLGYLQVKNWARQYAPGAILGVRTNDELEDMEPSGERFMGEADVVEKPGPKRRSESVAAIATETTMGAAPPPAATVIDASTGEIVGTPRTDLDVEPTRPEPQRAAATPAATPGAISGGQVAYLRNKLKAAGIGESVVCNRFEVDALELISLEQFSTLKAELLAAA